MMTEADAAVPMAAPQAAEPANETDDDSRNNDSQSDAKSSDDDSHEDDSHDDDSTNPDGLSSYERARLERIKRNQERLASLGLSQGNNIPQKKKVIKPRKKATLDLPTRELPSRAGRATFVETFKQRTNREKEEKNPDACYNCQKEGGELMCCDYCRTLYHSTCHPEITSTSVEGFRCTRCEVAGRKRRVACGLCVGCKRENDCETCVICVNNSLGAMTKTKCIFRRCQSWGKGVLEKDEGSEEEEAGDQHDSTCDKCNEGGDLICCDNCTKVFHSNCHKPKIYSLPDGHWTCMYCTVKPAREKKQAYKPKYGDILIADMGYKELTVTVNWPVLNCNTCEGKETTGAFVNPEWTSCRACGDSYHLKCLDPPLERRPNSWRCASCKEKKRVIRENRLLDRSCAKPKNEKLFEGIHDDDCYICINGGDLICCDYCSKVFHMQCHIPPLISIPKGNWKCCECAAVEYKRMMRCGECEACFRDDCGKCAMCLDKVKFGGPGKLKQTCEKKKCNYMRLAPPASRKSITEKDVKQQFKYIKPSKQKGEYENGLQRKRKHLSSSENAPENKKYNPFKRESVMLCQQTGFTSRIPPAKKVHSLDMTDTSSANDRVGSKIRTLLSIAMKKSGDSLIQKHACQYLRVFITNDKSVDNVIQLGCLLMLVKAMYEHFEDVSVLIEVVLTLTKMTLRNQLCGEKIFGSGCIALAIESMSSHKFSIEIQQSVCALLRALSCRFQNHQMLISVKAVEAVCLSLKLNSNKLGYLLDGCYFVQNILCNPHIAVGASRVFLSNELTSVIANGVTSFPNTSYFHVACNILTNLAIKNISRNGAEVDKLWIEKILLILELDVDTDTKKSALDALKALSIGKERFASDFIELDGIKKVLVLMKGRPKDCYLVKCGLFLIAGLIKGKESSQIFNDAGGINIIAQQMKIHQQSAFIQASACSILRNVVLSNIENEQAIETASSTLWALTNFKDNEVIQFDGRHAILNIISQCQSAAKLLNSKDIRKSNKICFIADESDVRSEVSAIDINQNHRDENVTKDCTIYTKDDSIYQKIKTIINKALNHPYDNKIADKACEQLRRLLNQDDENVERIVQLGGLDMIVNTMRSHPDKAVVQSEACATLSDLIWKHPKVVKQIVKAGCLPLVTKALNSHINNNKVQQMGLGVFRALSYENENHYFINGVDGFEVVLESLIHNSNRIAVLREVCFILQNMLSNPSIAVEQITLVKSKGVIPIILDTMKTSHDIDFLEGACGAIKNMAINTEAREAIGKCDGSIETIISLVESNFDTAVSKGALDALKVLACDEENRNQMKLSNGMEIIITFVTNSIDELDVVGIGLNLLLEFTRSDDMLDYGDVFHLITSAMEKYRNNSTIQEAGCQILGNLLLKNEEESQRAVETILTSIKNHYDDGDVQSSGLCALLSVCSDNPSTAKLLRTKDYFSVLCKSQLKIG